MHNIYKKLTVFCFAFSSIAVISQWGFLANGVFAIGINTTIVGGLFWGLLIYPIGLQRIRDNWSWYLPLWLILLSLAIYENPWLKLPSVILLMLGTGFVFSYREIKNCDSIRWDRELVSLLTLRAFSPPRFWGPAKSIIGSRISTLVGNAAGGVIRRAVLGIVILLPLAFLALSLLTSADANFDKAVAGFMNAVLLSLDAELIFKLLAIVVTTILTLAVLIAWQGEIEFNQADVVERRLDNVITGVVVSGLLLIYLAFLFFQIEYLLINDLPTDFSAAEEIVKSGFWQLFFLSFINALMFFVVYKKTSKAVQAILRAFVLASGLVVVSGCWRMGLYVFWYGLSYEKFFASYTAIYALIVFGFLCIASFARERKDVFRFIAFSSLWFYAMASLIPIERLIFHSNITLSRQLDSRIDLYHLSDLSLDVVEDVRQQIANGNFNATQWQGWLSKVSYESCNNRWYETNLSRLLHCNDH